MKTLKINQVKNFKFQNEYGKKVSCEILIEDNWFLVTLTKKGDTIAHSCPNLEPILKIGFTVDFEKVYTMYEEFLANYEKQQLELKLIELSNKYDNHPIHAYKCNIDSVTFYIESKSDFMKRALSSYVVANPLVGIYYKEKKFDFQYCTSGSNKIIEVVYSGELTNYRVRRYSNFDNTIKKIISLYDEKQVQTKAKEKRELIEKEGRQQALQTLNDLFGDRGVEAICKKEWVSGYSTRDRGYSVYRFYLVKNEQTYPISRPLSTVEAGKQISFTFAGLGKLTVKQIRKIIWVL